MRSFVIALMLAAILAGQLALGSHHHPLLLLAPAQVLLGVVAASLLLGELTWLTVIGGAASPLVLTWLHGWSTTVGVAALCGCWLAPRLWLARSRPELLRLVVVSMGAATLAGLVVARFVWAQPLYHFTACVFAGGSLALAAVVIPTDTLVATSLDAAARLLSGEVAEALSAAANAHRQGRQVSDSTERAAGQWRALLRLADQRLATRSAVGPEAEARRAELDAEIVSQARALAHPRKPVATKATATPDADAASPGQSESSAAAEQPATTAAATAEPPPAPAPGSSDRQPDPPAPDPARTESGPAVNAGSPPPMAGDNAVAESPPTNAPTASAEPAPTTVPASQP